MREFGKGWVHSDLRETALTVAARRGHVAVVSSLIAAHADLDFHGSGPSIDGNGSNSNALKGRAVAATSLVDH